MLEGCVWSLPNLLLLIQAKMFYFGFIHPCAIPPTAFWFIYMVTNKLKTGSISLTWTFLVNAQAVTVFAFCCDLSTDNYTNKYLRL